MSERTLVTKEPAKRPVRSSTGTRNRLSIANMDPNYKYRIVAVDNESRINRIQEMKDQGYDVVPEVQIGDNRADVGKGIGKAGIISLGQGVTGVAMRIPKEWYAEYQKEKHAHVDRISADLKSKLES